MKTLIQNHKAYKSVKKQLQEAHQKAGEFFGYAIKQLRGTKEEDVAEIRRIRKDRRFKIYYELKDVKSADDYYFNEDWVLKEIAFIKDLTAIESFIEREYRNYEQEYKTLFYFDLAQTWQRNQSLLESFIQSRISGQGYLISEFLMILPTEKERCKHFPFLEYFWSRKPIRIEILYR